MKIIIKKDYSGRRIIEQPCAACKKQIGEFESWNYCTPSGKIFGNLCEECSKYMDNINFK